MTNEPTSAATTMLSWKHPNPKAGEQEEPLCAEHLLVVREALSTLGIGCIGWEPDEPKECVRCGKQLPWRYYLFPSPPIYVGPDNHVFDYPEGPPVHA